MTPEAVDLPTLQQAVLDDATLESLLLDVSSLCAVRSVAFKRGAGEHAEEGEPGQLVRVREELARGAAVQLRYEYRGEGWCDTLLPGMSGVLLVRVREPVAPPGG